MGYAQLDATTTKKFQDFFAGVLPSFPDPCAAAKPFTGQKHLFLFSAGSPDRGGPFGPQANLMRVPQEASRQHRFDYFASYVRKPELPALVLEGE